jgi:Zn-dependent protease
MQMLRVRDEGLEIYRPGWPPVWIHASMPFVALLLTSGLWLPFRAHGLWVAAMVIPGAMLSVVAHELGHALVARRHGLRVSGIHLHGGGGQALIEGWMWSRKVDRKVTVAGPAVNLALAGLCFAAYGLLWTILELGGQQVGTHVVFKLRPTWATALWWVAWFNLILALVNLLPAFPLDGGHLARSFLEPRLGSIRAQYWIGLAGTILAVVAGFLFLVTLMAGVPVFSPPYIGPNLAAYQAARAGQVLRDP